jgi:cytochrome c-type biogenesis protein CcmH/NrfF
MKKMSYEPNEISRTGGLRQTPWWRWLLYAMLFGVAVSFLGIKYDPFLLYALPMAVLLIVAMFAGIRKALQKPSIRAWVFGNLWWIIPVFIFIQIALFVWTRIDERQKEKSSSQSARGTR